MAGAPSERFWKFRASIGLVGGSGLRRFRRLGCLGSWFRYCAPTVLWWEQLER